MILKLAWRNIWRNKRRTLITVASILFAVLFSIFMNSFQKGAWVRMLDNIVNYYYGYAQIHQKGYWEEKSINDVLELTDELWQLPNQIDGLEQIIPRLETFALLSSGEHTSGMMIVGTNPDAENQLTKLKSRLIEGTYFNQTDKTLLIAEGVKDLLKVSLGDTLIILTQGYHGVNAAGKYPIKGIVHFASPDLNKRMIYLPLEETQDLLGAPSMATSLTLRLNDRDDLEDVIQQLETQLDTEKYEIMDWQSMLPDLVEAQKTDAAGNYIFLLVLYLIISFGIFGTILMMVKEREHEFGILLSIGMSRAFLAFSTWVEILLMALIGVVFGMLAALPLVHYFKVNPIDFSEYGEMAESYEKWGFDPIFPTVMDASLFYSQAIIMAIITSLLALFAIWKIFKLKPVEAMRE